MAVWALWPKQPGKRVTVTVDGMEQGSYALAADTEIPIAGYGGYSLRLVIQNGKAHVEDFHLPGQVEILHMGLSILNDQPQRNSRREPAIGISVSAARA